MRKGLLFELSVWIPVLGLASMVILTKFGKYRYVYYAGYLWPLYQLICVNVCIVLTIIALFEL